MQRVQKEEDEHIIIGGQGRYQNIGQDTNTDMETYMCNHQISTFILTVLLLYIKCSCSYQLTAVRWADKTSEEKIIIIMSKVFTLQEDNNSGVCQSLTIADIIANMKLNMRKLLLIKHFEMKINQMLKRSLIYSPHKIIFN